MYFDNKRRQKDNMTFKRTGFRKPLSFDESLIVAKLLEQYLEDEHNIGNEIKDNTKLQTANGLLTKIRLTKLGDYSTEIK
jgi:hypothetical protein